MTMRFYVTVMLYRTAMDLASRAERCSDSGRVQAEVAASISAQLLLGLTLEGAINEAAEAYLPSWAWDRFEKADTSLKWCLVLRLFGTEEPDPGKEPLQTIAAMQRTRNMIAHPKAWETDADAIARYADGRVERNVPDEHIIATDVTNLYFGYGRLLDEFNATTTKRALDRTLSALRNLREVAPLGAFDWFDDPAKTESSD
jgi:hypothetical protein